jgi:hypothetical protein
MPKKRQSRIRWTEVFTGMILILLAISYIVSLLLDFKFVSPDGSPLEDLGFLSEHIENQKISSYCWLTTSLLALLAVPFYIGLFRKKIKVLVYLNGLCLLGAATGFFLMSNYGFDLHQDMTGILGQALDQISEQVKLHLFGQFEREQFYRRIGSTSVGLFSLGLSMTKFRLKKFPFLSFVILMVSGPVLIFFNWYDPEHLARTGAMAGIMIGMIIFCVRLINKGMV